MDKAALIVYLSNNGYELTYHNDTFICQNYPLSIIDLNNVIENIKAKHKLKDVIITNIIPLTNK